MFILHQCSGHTTVSSQPLVIKSVDLTEKVSKALSMNPSWAGFRIVFLSTINYFSLSWGVGRLVHHSVSYYFLTQKYQVMEAFQTLRNACVKISSSDNSSKTLAVGFILCERSK